MEIRPIFASLRKHKIPAALIVLEIALACAVFCNAVFMLSQRIGEIRLPNAIDQQGIVDISVRGTDPKLANADIPRNVAALRAIPGVDAVAAINNLPLGGPALSGNVANRATEQAGKGYENITVAWYWLGRGGTKALGLRLLRGRFFNDDEYADGKLGDNMLPGGHAVIVTQSLASRLWPDGDALGKPLWALSNRYQVIGVAANVLRPSQNGGGLSHFYDSIFFPVRPNSHLRHYIVRTNPRDRAHVLRAATAKLQALSPNAVVKGRTFSDIRAKYFASARSMIWILVLVCVVMLAVTAFGIVGLTSFWVRQRRRQIGIRRAVGATRAQIMQYFQTENFLLGTAGVVLGIILAFGINAYLMRHYQLNRMPWYYLPVSAVALWVLGQLAVLGPALRASKVPPVVATRSV